MESISKVFLTTHIIAGFCSLLLFWIPVFTRKGGINHRKIGKIYIFFMWIVVLTAAVLSIKNLLLGIYIQAAFLGFLSMITGQVLWKGIAVLKNKKGISPQFFLILKVFDISIFLFGLILVIYGIYLKGEGAGILMLIFGILGLSNFKQIWTYFKNPATKVDWYNDHLETMIISGVAAYTAFFVFGGQQFLSGFLTGQWMIIPWVAPTVIGVFSMKYLKGYYARKRGKSVSSE